MARGRMTKEEKIAIKLADTVSDLTLDLDKVGMEMATSPTVLVDRLQVVLESAREAKYDKWNNK